MAAMVVHDKKAAALVGPWQGFVAGLWQKEINVRDFIQQNYEPYDGDDSFLTGATKRTQKIWATLQALFVEERKKRRPRRLADSQRPSPPTRPATSIATTKSSSVCRPTRR